MFGGNDDLKLPMEFESTDPTVRETSGLGLVVALGLAALAGIGYCAVRSEAGAKTAVSARTTAPSMQETPATTGSR